MSVTRWAGDGRFELYRSNARTRAARIPLHHPPTFCLALLADSLAGKSELEALREAWSGGGEGFLAEPHPDRPRRWPRCRRVGGAPRAVRRRRRPSGPSAARLLALQRQYTAFRMVHDQLQNAFDTVENFLARSHLPPTWLAFACEPTEAPSGRRHSDAFSA